MTTIAISLWNFPTNFTISQIGSSDDLQPPPQTFSPPNYLLIAELAERSAIIVVTHQAEKIWMHDRTTVQGATFNMCGQLYRGHANATALFSSPVVSALGSESDDPGSSPGRGKALCPWDVREKKNASSAFRLG